MHFDADVRLGNSPASINFGGDVFLESSSIAVIELEGLGLGQFDQFDVAGDLTLAGDLSVSLLGGFRWPLARNS